MRSFLIGVLAVLGLLLLLNALPVALFPDAPASQEAQWNATLEQLEPDQNAMQAFAAASQALKLNGVEPRGFLQPEGWIQSEAARLIGRNEAALQALERGANMKRSLSGLRDPSVQSLESFEQTSFNSGLIGAAQAANVLLVRAKLKLFSGDDLGAWADLRTALGVGQRMLEARGDSLQLEIGAAVFNAALTEMRLALSRSNFASDFWKRELEALQRFGLNDAMVLEQLRTDYRYGDLLLQHPRPAFPANIVPKAYSLQINRSRNALAAALQQQFELSQNCAALKDHVASKRENPLWFELNSLGRSAISAALGNGETAITVCQVRQNLNATVVMMALRAQQIKTGRLPARLEDLRTWLPRRPTDQFSGQDFLYEPQNKLLRGSNGLGYQFEF
jgi:hypothetical protein